jgi:hypothetical protein
VTRRDGTFLVEDFFVNTGGLDTSSSPFAVADNCATGGMNFDYIKRGGVQKRLGHSKLNAAPNSQLTTLGISLWDKPGSVRKPVRAAGTKLQAFDFNTLTFTDMTEDTATAGASFLPGSSSVPVVGRMFNTPSTGTLWMIGGGMTSSLYGAYSAAKITANGVPTVIASSFTATVSAAGATLPVGTYHYTLAYRKASTQATGNGSTATEVAATVVNLGDKIQLNWTLTNNDTTKFDKIYIYRSSVGGAAGFTAGALLAIVDSTVTTYADVGASPYSSSEVVPRAGNGAGDNSQLPSSLTLAGLAVFNRRLVTCADTTVYFSDVNKPESWPTYQTITVPSGGAITGLGVISLSNALSSDIQEVLCVFKQNELWIISGDGTITGLIPNWALKYIGNYGAGSQALIVDANGALTWCGYRGMFVWSGSGKPSYISRPIEDKFQRSGDIDKSKLGIGFGIFAHSRGEVQWYLSSKTFGEQKYCLKLDLKLTFDNEGDVEGLAALSINHSIKEGKFTPDVLPFPVYAGLSFLTASDATDESLYLGDNAGYLYTAYLAYSDAGLAVPFEYTTPYLTFGEPGTAKRVTKVVAWTLDTGTSFDMVLNYWSNYRYKAADATSRSQTIKSEGTANALWGLATWGTSLWSTFSSRIKPIVFNLDSIANNSEGDSIRLSFTQSGSTQQVVLYGFSVFYSEIGSRR